MFNKIFTRKFIEEIATSSVKLAVAGEVARGLQQGARTLLSKAATLTGRTTETEEAEEVTFFNDDNFDTE
jgi:hypothetical protein